MEEDIFAPSMSIVPEDDIFAAHTSSPPTDDVLRPTAETPVEDDLFAFVADDRHIFAAAASTKAKQNDDIFVAMTRGEAVTSTPVDLDVTIPSVTRRRAPKATTADEDIFADDTDIFTDLPPSKARAAKRSTRKHVSKSKSLFTDDVGTCSHS